MIESSIKKVLKNYFERQRHLHLNAFIIRFMTLNAWASLNNFLNALQFMQTWARHAKNNRKCRVKILKGHHLPFQGVKCYERNFGKKIKCRMLCTTQKQIMMIRWQKSCLLPFLFFLAIAAVFFWMAGMQSCSFSFSDGVGGTGTGTGTS